MIVLRIDPYIRWTGRVLYRLAAPSLLDTWDMNGRVEDCDYAKIEATWQKKFGGRDSEWRVQRWPMYAIVYQTSMARLSALEAKAGALLQVLALLAVGLVFLLETAATNPATTISLLVAAGYLVSAALDVIIAIWPRARPQLFADQLEEDGGLLSLVVVVECLNAMNVRLSNWVTAAVEDTVRTLALAVLSALLSATSA